MAPCRMTSSAALSRPVIPMRVALLAHSNSPWAPYYARHFLDRGHEVLAISFHPKPIPDVDLRYVGAEEADGRLPKGIYLRRVPRVRRLLRGFGPDVVLAPYIRSNGLVGALTKCSALVVSSRGADQDWGLPDGLDRAVLRWVAGRAEIVHASSPELGESLAGSGVDPGKIVVIPLGTDSVQFSPLTGPRPAGPARILCNRKHYAIYDNDTIVRALALLRADGFEFECRFAGTGPTLEATRRLACDLGLLERVRFLGDLEHHEVPRLLHWADLFVSAAHSDGAPSSLFEAMSAGVFPIVTDVRANRDWLEQETTGYLCRLGRPEDWARGIRFAWENPEVRSRAAAINRSRVRRDCDRVMGLLALEDLLARAVRLYRGRP